MSQYNKLQGYDPDRGILVDVAALVDHPNKDTVRVRYEEGCQIATFQAHGQPLEVMIACEGYDSYRLKVIPPIEGQFMVLTHNHETREFLIEYSEIAGRK